MKSKPKYKTAVVILLTAKQVKTLRSKIPALSADRSKIMRWLMECGLVSAIFIEKELRKG